MWKYTIFFLTMLLSACSTKPTVTKSDPILLNASTIESNYFKNNFKVESIIPIETTESFLISEIRKIIRLKDYLLLLSDNQSVSLIDAHTGQLKMNICKFGNGPGESKHIIDIAFDEISNQILIYNDYYKLLFFNLQGKFLSEIKLENSMYENITCHQGEVLFYNKIEGYSCYPYTFSIYNLKDKTWNRINNDIKVNFPIRSKGRQMVRSKRIWFNALLDYNLYCMEGNEYSFHYQLDFPTFKLSEDLIKKSTSNPMDFFTEVAKGKIVYSINSVRETDKHLVFRSNQGGLYFLQKDNDILYKDDTLLMASDYFPHDGEDNCILFVVSAEKWEEQYKSMDCSMELRKKMEKLNTNEDDNPILVFYAEVG